MESDPLASVHLPSELARFVAERVRSGRSKSLSDVLCEAVRLMQEHDAAGQPSVEQIRRQIAVGIDQLERGETLDPDAVFKEIRERAKERRRAS
jgi:antitoxin ParD1/3/4